MHIKFKYYKPRDVSFYTSFAENEGVVSKQMIYTEQVRKTAKRNIPIMSKIYPETFVNLARAESELKLPALVKVALYLTMKLDTENCLIVFVKAREIEEDLKLSDKTVTKVLEYLEELNLISTLARGKYKLSAKLGFFGQPSAWNIAIEFEQEGEERVLEEIEKFNAHKKDADRQHSIKYIDKFNLEDKTL
jgi:hypothetical protein